MILESQIFLGNLDSAEQLLCEMAKSAANENRQTFIRLFELGWACLELGLDKILARMIDDSAYADFLRPLSLALRKMSGEETIDVAPAEIAALANEVRSAIDGGQTAPNVRR